jgi:hypothetical protein
MGRLILLLVVVFASAEKPAADLKTRLRFI